MSPTRKPPPGGPAASEGELAHSDNHGGHGVLRPGDAQWMTAGRGIIHRELAHQGRRVHTLQLWLNLPADRKLTEPRYQDLRAEEMPVVRQPGDANTSVHMSSIGNK